MQWPTDPATGDEIGAFRIESQLGEGATGTVYRAVRVDDGVTVALKVLRRELARDDVYRRRFAHEARAAREVAHAQLVPVIDAGEFDGRPYIAMAFLHGGSLADRLRADGVLPIADVLRLAADVGAGMDALHRCGLVHRDVKPSNILFDAAGSAALTDFGLAKGRAYTVLTKPGQPLGTPDYMAPEVISGEPATAASDVYGLGCVVFACLTGRAPFASANPFEVAVGHLGKEPPDPRQERAEVSPELAAAALPALAKNPSERPATGRHYALALLSASEPTSA
jgi:serine/threonine-protein kinase